MGQIENKKQNDRFKLTVSVIMLNISHINTVISKAEIARLDNKAKIQVYVTYRNKSSSDYINIRHSRLQSKEYHWGKKGNFIMIKVSVH